MNIAIVLPYLKAGGTERQASYIANDLSEKGHRVTVVCIERQSAFRDLFNVPVEYLNSKNSNFKLLANFKNLVNTLVRLQIDVVLSRAWSVNLVTSAAASKADIPSVLFLSGSIDLSHHSGIKRKIHKHFIQKAAHVISVSNKAKGNCVRWLQIDKNKITVIHNGVDLKRVAKKSAHTEILPEYLTKLEAPKIVFVGRLIHRKGLDLLLKSISEIKGIDQTVELIVVGGGEEKPAYKKLAQDLGIYKNVHFVGEQKNPFPFMKLADIFVLPSRSEGFPNVLLEAMALGLPVIASNCETGPGEILNGKNGLLVDPNSSESLFEPLNLLLNNDTVRSEIGSSGKDTVRQYFQIQKQLDKIERTLVEVSEILKSS